jgi:pseudoazurin
MHSLFKLILGASLVVATGAIPAAAANVNVQLLNKGADGTAMVFEPSLVKIDVGDSVTFQPVDKGHDVQSIDGMIPAGATSFKGEINQPFTETFTVPGVYAVRCLPHYALGMVGVVVVGGDLSNLDALKAAHNPKLPQQRFDTIFAELAK